MLAGAEAGGLCAVVDADAAERRLDAEIGVELPRRRREVVALAEGLRVEDDPALADLAREGDGVAMQVAPLGEHRLEAALGIVEPVANGFGAWPPVEAVVPRPRREKRMRGICGQRVVLMPRAPVDVLDAEDLELAQRREHDEAAALLRVGLDVAGHGRAREAELVGARDRIDHDRVVALDGVEPQQHAERPRVVPLDALEFDVGEPQVEVEIAPLPMQVEHLARLSAPSLDDRELRIDVGRDAAQLGRQLARRAAVDAVPALLAHP